jgi:hypothetical protein
MDDNINKLQDEKMEIEEKIKEAKLRKIKNNDSANHNKIIRVSKKFDEEISEIANKKSISKPKVTDLIVKHKTWVQIKEDIFNFVFGNKKGQMTVAIFMLLFVVFAAAILIFTAGTALIEINAAVNQSIQIGQVNLQNISEQTIGIATTSFLNNADWYGIATIFGMIIGLFLASYFMRNRYPKMLVIFDILIIFSAFLISLYLTSTYRLILDTLSSAGRPFLETYTPRTSIFILNLPIFSVIVGVIMMVLTHSSIPNKFTTSALPGGKLQGL